MSRALRYAPPLTTRALIVRPRLLACLHARFQRPVTAIVAPAGFGKTTLLAQAVQENALSPLGEDRWLTCQRDDTALSSLASGAFTALGVTAPVPEDPRGAAVAAAEAMWSRAPRHVALILDDAHQLHLSSAGGRFVSELVDELPRNGHLVIASRPPLPLPTSRLLANGDATVLSQDDLHFEDDELAAFAACRKVPRELLSEVGGWPALAELTATAGPSAVTGYVWEELLSRLSAEHLRALALLGAVGGADDEIATALLGRDVRLEELLDGLPLVVRGGSGWWSLHGLWSAVLRGRLDDGQVAQARRTAGLVLARRRRYHDAMHLLIDGAAWDEVRDLVIDVCEVGTPLVPPDVLGVWLRRLPAEVQRSPVGLLLAAMIAEPVSPDTAEQLLERSFAAPQNGAGVRVACLNALVEVAFRRGDRRQMESFLARLTGLAGAGDGRTAGWIALFRALLTPSPVEVRAALAAPSLVSGAPLSPVQDWLRGHLLLLKLGDAAAAEPVARRALAHAAPNLSALFCCQLMESVRLRGDLGAAEHLLPGLLAGIHPAKVQTSPELVTYAVVLLSVLGRHEEADGLLQEHRSTIAGSSVAWAPIAGAVAEAFHLVSLGLDEAATSALRSVLHLPVVRKQAVVQVSPAALPLLYVLVPEVRARWDAEPPPGCFAPVQRLAQALVALRDRGSLVEVSRLPQDAPTVMRAVLPTPWTAELAIGMVAAGRQEGRTLLEELGARARASLRSQSTSAPAPVATTARRLLRELPVAPAHRLELQVLGPMELRRDGQVVIVPELRRERVRQLLGYLLSHDRPTRAAIMADLWPSLDEAAAGRNLRVTLTYLHDVLEPERRDPDPPYFVRSASQTLHLVVDAALDVDALRFEQHLEEAVRLEGQGVPSAALIAYERALDLWRTDYLPDVTGGDWLDWERERLRGRFVGAAVRAGELLLARGDAVRSRCLGERALQVDSWSESAHQLLVAALLESGDLLDAQRRLRRCHRMLAELGVAAQARTVALDRRVEAQLRGSPGLG